MGLTVLDAGVLIAVLDGTDEHHQASRTAVSAALARGSRFVLPASAYAELLVAPFRRDVTAADAVDALVDALPAPVEPISRAIARRAAQLRAAHGSRLRLPDALVVATALELAAHDILTTDRRWPEMGVRTVVID